ncbi:aspartyl/glutamyl-tRNA amidotransferase subunit A [Candidatus Parcubacteria bacterium]|nr:aspartyl/glutamyl-tRNA amidotransferase subunit A [Candidatus Parcubacteria bacterium]
MGLNSLTIKEASKKLKKGEITSVELTKACLKRIKDVDGKVKALLTVCEDEALNEAEMADKQRKKGKKGDLLGIPYIAKDNIMTKEVRTTAASKILDNYIAPYDATIIKKLKKAGAVLLGKANLDEFAHGASTENSAYGTTHNPWDLTRVPGGSSGGSAAAVASDMCVFALGTDTGGSIRHPASFCGVVGTKPTYGRASRFGLIAMTSSTDVPGPITKTVEDTAIVLKTIAGQDRNDATTPDKAVPDYLGSFKKSLKGQKIGIPREFFSKGLDKNVKETVEEAIEKIKDLGAEIINISLPHTKYGVAVYYIITPSEISSNLARFDGIRYGHSASTTSPSTFAKASADKPAPLLPLGLARDRRKERGEKDEVKTLMDVYMKSRGEGFGPEAKRRIMLGTYALSAGYFDAYYLQAQKVRTIIIEEFDEVLSQVDCILTPTTSTIAFKIGEQIDDPLAMYLEDIFVTGASLAGLPAISIPAGFAKGMPVGLQLIGQRFGEQTIFNVANTYEQATSWHTKKPKL